MSIGAKLLQAIGIACVMVGLVHGISGDMWMELYLLLAGIAVFFVGWLIERRRAKRAPTPSGTSRDQALPPDDTSARTSRSDRPAPGK